MKLFLLFSFALASVQRIQSDEETIIRDYENDDVDDLTILNAHSIHKSLNEIKDGIRSLTIKDTPSNTAGLVEALSDFKSEVQFLFNETTIKSCQSGIEEIKLSYENLQQEIKASLQNSEEKILSWLNDFKALLTTNKASSQDPRCTNRAGDVAKQSISVGTYHIFESKNGQKADRIKAIAYCSKRGMVMASFEREEELAEFSKIYPKNGVECCTSGRDRSGTKRQKAFVWESTGSDIKQSMLGSEDSAITKFNPTTELCISVAGIVPIRLIEIDCNWGCSCIICEVPDYCEA
ncbi:uncharacterized protein LOC135934968 isoform X2 [Cloeon dipterum]|uniref:uncharacterized protein LOC135934968 isoform X2 n=1 Tax=Cloeon dipterum TaxID=197152 RepID=UPI00321FE1EA